LDDALEFDPRTVGKPGSKPPTRRLKRVEETLEENKSNLTNYMSEDMKEELDEF
jgi:hypothetical protein